MLIGAPGAGKTKLSLELASELGVQVLHLDQKFHGEKLSQEPFSVWCDFVQQEAQKPSWIMDGNYFDVFSIRCERASHLIWLDPPWIKSTYRFLLRTYGFRGATRPDLGIVEKVNLQLIWKLTAYRYRRRKDFWRAFEIARTSGVKCLHASHTLSAKQVQDWIYALAKSTYGETDLLCSGAEYSQLG